MAQPEFSPLQVSNGKAILEVDLWSVEGKVREG
jgi:hypothetical protein